MKGNLNWMKPLYVGCALLLLGGCRKKPEPTIETTPVLVLEVEIEGQPPQRFESAEGWIGVALDDQDRLEELTVANLDISDLVAGNEEITPERLEQITWLLFFGLDEPVPFSMGSVSSSLWDPLVSTAAIGSFEIGEHGDGERLELVEIDTAARTAVFSYTSPVTAVNPSLCLDGLSECPEADWTPVSGTVTATISGRYEELTGTD